MLQKVSQQSEKTMNSQEIHVVVMIDMTENSSEIEPLGVFSDQEAAQECINNLTKLNTEPQRVFTTIVMGLNAEPDLLTKMKADHEKRQEAIDNILMRLMKDDLIEQLIGEDGNFYYRVTEKGKAARSKFPEQFRKFFKH
jgi:hypothetical protein